MLGIRRRQLRRMIKQRLQTVVKRTAQQQGLHILPQAQFAAEMVEFIIHRQGGGKKTPTCLRLTNPLRKFARRINRHRIEHKGTLPHIQPLRGIR